MSTVDLSKLGNIINDGSNGQVLTSQGGSNFSFADAAAGGASVTSSDTAPSSPSAGDLWFDSSTAELLVWYVDGSSNQWVGVSGTAGQQGVAGSAGSSVTSYAAPTNFPSSGNTVGDFAFATNSPKALYVWDGAEWDRVWSGGQEGGPTFTTSPSSSYTLSGGANTDVTVAASDPDGFPVEYSVVTNPANQAQATITQPSTGLFRFSATSNSSNAGSFTAKFIADDGVQKATSSSAFSLAFGVLVDYLIVGAGGGGGVSLGGGGGAGGLIYSQGIYLPFTTFTITVGAGGNGATSGTSGGTNGANSVISGSGLTTLTAIGGGRGGTRDGTTGNHPLAAVGGSGGGGSYQTNGAAGTTNQGFAGGNGVASGSPFAGGGGGGSAAVGQAGATVGNNGGNGGAGTAISITGSSLFYAAGGGGAAHDGVSGSVGGTGGSSIGGNGVRTGNATAGTANTGSGGGAARASSGVSGGAGGSGIVIIRTLSTASATSGSPTLTTDGSYNIYKFTSSGTIAFSS